MTIQEQIKEYISSQLEPKRSELNELHEHIISQFPNDKLWYLDGKNDEGKQISNPNIGYGEQTINYKDGTSRSFYKIGLSGNTTGISVYIIGIEDKKYLSDTYTKSIGKATVTGYCIKFKSLNDINLDILTDAIRFGMEYKK